MRGLPGTEEASDASSAGSDEEDTGATPLLQNSVIFFSKNESIALGVHFLCEPFPESLFFLFLSLAQAEWAERGLVACPRNASNC